MIAIMLIAICASATAAFAGKGIKKLAQAEAGPGKPASMPEAATYAARADAMQAADDIAQRDDLDPAWVRETIGEARFLPNVPRLMLPPPAGTPKNWTVYRNRFVNPARIRAGVRFWQENRDALERAEQQYGVPPQIVVGILGVETIYGRQMGNYRVLDALATLAFDFPAAHPRAAERTAFFRNELEQFLLWAHRSGTDPLAPRGSYAGAMGMPQFMPSSVAKYAVDFDGKGSIDLALSAADAIGSVANYLHSFGWVPGVAPIYPVRFDPATLELDALLAPDILPTFSAASFEAKGALLPDDANGYPGKLALVELQNGADGPTFVAGTENFYVITRYNWSSYYAMAVIDLGRAVAAALAGVD